MHESPRRSRAERSASTPRGDRDGGTAGRAPARESAEGDGGLAILHGNLAPEGCVVKLAGHERREHTGPARVFESEEDAMAAVTAGAITPVTSS